MPATIQKDVVRFDVSEIILADTEDLGASIRRRDGVATVQGRDIKSKDETH